MLRTYKNDTDTIKSFFDAHGNPVTVDVGETVTYVAERDVVSPSDDGGNISVPPVGMQRIINLYRNPETGKVEIEFTDSLRE